MTNHDTDKVLFHADESTRKKDDLEFKDDDTGQKNNNENHQDEWNRLYQKLAECVKQQQGKQQENESVDLEAICKDHPTLKTWLQQQRRDFCLWKEGNPQTTMTLERQEKLDHFKIPWRVFNQWFDRYIELVDYHHKHGHCLVPPTYEDNPELGKWVKMQRQSFRNYKLGKRQQQPGSGRRRWTALTKRRVRLFDRLDFEINVLDARWNLKFRELVAYQKHHGHCRVPDRSKEYPVLAEWVKTQRKVYMNYQQQQQSQHLSTVKTEASNKNKNKRKSLNSGTVLTPDRMQRLNSIGFDWDPLETAWQQHYQQLVAFAKRHGHVKIPKEGITSSLAMWLYKQRHAYHQRQHQQQQEEDEKHGSTKNVVKGPFITPERIRLLEQVPGFEWNPLETAWQKRYQELVDYHATHGHCLVPHVYPDNPPFGLWVYDQRRAYKHHVSSRKDVSPTTTSSAAAREGPRTARLTPERIELLNQIDFFHQTGRDNMRKKKQQQQQAPPEKTKAPEQPCLYKKEEGEEKE